VLSKKGKVPADASLLCDEFPVLMDTINWTPCTVLLYVTHTNDDILQYVFASSPHVTSAPKFFLNSDTEN